MARIITQSKWSELDMTLHGSEKECNSTPWRTARSA